MQPEPEPVIPMLEADLSYLKRAQIQWERRIQKSLNSMCNELNVPLARMRFNADKEELTEKWDELSTYDVGKSSNAPLNISILLFFLPQAVLILTTK